jgi:excinuclease ABC subunit A
VIDLGPEGGDGGGQIVAVGTPEDVAGVAGSHTGEYLRRVLAAASRSPPAQAKRKAAKGR